MGYTESYACGVQVRPYSEARETEAGITEESCVQKKHTALVSVVSITKQISYSPWLHRIALFTAGATFLLIVIGGIVTSTESGLAVPDWPNTFGYNMFLYPLSEMVGGILYEHSHRLMGSIVGLLTIALFIMLILKDSRRWIKWLGLVAFIAVSVQRALGGLRVLLDGLRKLLSSVII